MKPETFFVSGFILQFLNDCFLGTGRYPHHPPTEKKTNTHILILGVFITI